VVLDDDEHDVYAAPLSEWEMRGPDEAEAVWQRERERDEEVERTAADIAAQWDDEYWDDEGRALDLAPRDCVPSPLDDVDRAPRIFTDAQVRVANEWWPVARREGRLKHLASAHGENWSAPTLGNHYEDARDDPDRLARAPGTRWLKQHDPERTAEGVAGEVESALNAHELNDDDVRAAFSGGRPTAHRRALRARVRDALTTMYEDDRSRVLMAQALGCSRQALHKLMGASA
jgi:hypothetical protein